MVTILTSYVQGPIAHPLESLEEVLIAFDLSRVTVVAYPAFLVDAALQNIRNTIVSLNVYFVIQRRIMCKDC